MRVKEDHRNRGGVALIDTTIQDVRYAARTLRKNPAFTATVVLTLAVGIGATAAIFTVVHAVLRRPLPYSASDRLVEVTETIPLKRWTHTVAAPANFADWQKMNRVFDGMAAFNGPDHKGASNFNLFFTGAAEPQQLKALSVTGNLFRVLGSRRCSDVRSPMRKHSRARSVSSSSATRCGIRCSSGIET